MRCMPHGKYAYTTMYVWWVGIIGMCTIAFNNVVIRSWLPGLSETG